MASLTRTFVIHVDQILRHQSRSHLPRRGGAVIQKYYRFIRGPEPQDDLARFTQLRAEMDSTSHTVRVRWATYGAHRVLIGGKRYPRRGSVRVPVMIGGRLTLTPIDLAGAAGEARCVYLTPTFEGTLPLTARPVQAWRDYLAMRAAASEDAVHGFRRMLVRLRPPRMRLRLGQPIGRTAPQPVRLAAPIRPIVVLPGRLAYLPVSNIRAELPSRFENVTGSAGGGKLTGTAVGGTAGTAEPLSD
jgi:hypothetical protein